jgi:dinuclear metal center YbgI/SA1388 family protein
MAELDAVVRFLDNELRTSEVPEYDAALNGLQLANEGRVTRIAAAVDFSAETVRLALADRADLLLVHHGMFWGGAQRLTGAAFERLRAAITGGLAVYGSHIPLDLHPGIGNNVLLAKALQLDPTGTFGRFKGVEIGVGGTSDVTTSSVVERAREFAAPFGTTVVSTRHTAERRTKRWAIITGAGASSDTLDEALERGVDTLIVGEGPHHTAVLASERGLVVIYAGHYATETLGVQALARMASERFGVPWAFVDAPTGL